MSLIERNIETTFSICCILFTYITKKLVRLPSIFLNIHGSSIFDKIKYFDYFIKNRSTYSSMPALIHKYICPPTGDKLSRWCVAIAKIQNDIPISNLLGHTYWCFNHGPYLIDVQGVHFRCHSFKLSGRVFIHDYLYIDQENIILNNVWYIIILNDKFISEWYITHSD